MSEMLNNEQRAKRMKQVYIAAVEFLNEIAPAELQEGELNRYFDIQKTFKTKNEILYRLLASLQNRGMMSKVLGFENESRQPIFKSIFFDYDSNTILNTYTAETLFKCFGQHFNFGNAESKKNLWYVFAKAAISACEFLKEFNDADDFDKFVIRFTYNELSAAALPRLLEKEIYGLGFPLACDFLKEIGYTGYPKPDVHIKDILCAFDLCDNNDYAAYKAVVEMANVVNETPYKVDKVLWLIGSGNYYYHKISIGRNKDKFIQKMKTILSQ